MRSVLVGVTLLLVSWKGFAQDQKVARVTVYDGVAQKRDAKPFIGLPYRLSARVRVDTTRAGKSNAWISVRVDDAKKHYVGSARLPKQVTEKTWRTYTVQGKFPKKADSVVVMAGGYLDGPFGFDDFKLEVERRPGQWETVPLRNPGFEEAATDSAGIPAGWKPFWSTRNFIRQVAADSVGNRYLSLRGHDVVNYGWNPAAGHFVMANGVKLYYETYGQGEPLLLLHGNGESIGSFQQQIGELARHYQVIAVDTRDQGKSAATKGRLSYDLFADDMHALMEQLQLSAAHIVGWSDGGNTGLSMALRYPAQVKSLVTMGANLYADNTSVDPKMLKEVRQGKLLFTVLSPFKKSFRRGRRLTTMLLKYPKLKPEQLRAITAPVLVLAGEKDIILEPHTRLIAENIPGAQLVILPKLTHYAPQENGPLFNQTVLDFLQKVPVRQ